MYDLGIMKGEVYLGKKMVKTNLYIKSGKIVTISDLIFPAAEVVDAENLWVLPGLIDPHVHLSLKVGDYTSYDDFATGGYEAAKGGISTIIDFLDPIETEDGLEKALRNRMSEAVECPIDYGFHATLGNFKGDVSKIVEMTQNLGLLGIKVFTTYSESNRMISTEKLNQLLDADCLTLVHAEADHLVDPNFSNISAYGDSRPIQAELEAVRYLLDHHGQGRLYIVHTSSGSAVEILRGHKNIYIESCPQYFTFDQSVFEREDGASYLLAPPFRSEAEKKKLALCFNDIHTIGTDHCPFLKEEKNRFQDASKIPKGVGGLRFSFLVMYNQFGLDAVEKMSRNVSEIFGLWNKGDLSLGKDADLMIFNPQGTTLGEGIYSGKSFEGQIVHTFSRGAFVVKSGMPVPNKGRYIRGGGQ